MTSAQKLAALEQKVKDLITALSEHTFTNAQPYKGTLTRGQGGKLGYEITVYAETPEELKGEIASLQTTFDQFCGIAPAETTLSAPPTSIPYTAGDPPF